MVEFDDPNRVRERHGIKVHKDMTIKALKSKIAEAVNDKVSADSLQLAAVDDSSFYCVSPLTTLVLDLTELQIYEDNDKMPEKATVPREIHAFEIKPQFESEVPSIIVPVVHRYFASGFGPPFLMLLPLCAIEYH